MCLDFEERAISFCTACGAALARFRSVGNQNRPHAGRFRGTYTSFGIFYDVAVLGQYAESMSGEKKYVGCWLPAWHFVPTDDDRETISDTCCLKLGDRALPLRRCGDRLGKTSGV